MRLRNTFIYSPKELLKYSYYKLSCSSRQWTCPKCNLFYKNLYVKSCIQCEDTQLITLESSIIFPKETWLCILCNNRNEYRYSVCKSCSVERFTSKKINNKKNKNDAKDNVIWISLHNDKDIWEVMRNLCPRLTVRTPWTCKSCSFENHISIFGCVLCGVYQKIIDDTTEEVIEKNQLAFKKIKYIKEICEKRNLIYIDRSFPPMQLSVDKNKSHLDKETVISWRRPSEMEIDDHRTWRLYSDKLYPHDISQGFLGDCWLAAVLMLFTRWPEQLKSCILREDINTDGVYLVNLYQAGNWIPVILDDFFPCDEEGMQVYCMVTIILITDI